MIQLIPYYIIRSLLITVIIEVLIALILKIKDKKDILNIILVNIFTNLLLNAIIIYINIFYGIRERNVNLIFLEIFIVFIEGFVYSKVLRYKKFNVYLLSIILNLSSYILGEIINNFM